MNENAAIMRRFLFQNTAAINYLAENPDAGVVMQGTGGIRKLCWAAQGKGKRSRLR
jgi:hypothetical protein